MNQKILPFLSFLLATSILSAPITHALTYQEVASGQIGTVLGDSTSLYPYPTASLVKYGQTIYFINATTKIPFTNYKAFVGLGYSLINVISGDLSGYVPAQSYKIYSSTQEHPWGSWLLYNKTVYYSHESGLIPVPSWDVFLSEGGDSKFIVKANSADVAVLKNQHGIIPLQSQDSRLYGFNPVAQSTQHNATNTATTNPIVSPNGAFQQLDSGTMIYTVQDDGLMSQPLVGDQSSNPPLIAKNLAKNINFSADMFMVVPGYTIDDPHQGFGAAGKVDLGNSTSLMAYERLDDIGKLDFSDANKINNFRYLVMHELGHTFGVGFDNSIAFGGLSVTDGGGHWARNVLLPTTLMGGNCLTNYKDNGDMTISSSETFDNCKPNENKFDPFLMYLAGLNSATDVANVKYLVTDPAGNLANGTRILKYLTIQDIISGYQKVDGPPIDQKKDFKLALVLFMQKGQQPSLDQINKIKQLGALIPTWWNEGTFGKSTISLSSN